MSLKHFVAAALVSTAAFAADPDFVVPAIASTEGARGSVWTSELTLHNAGLTPLSVRLSYHTGSAVLDETVIVPGRSTISYGDVAVELFEAASTIGALEIDVVGGEARKLAVASRTVNTLGTSELGQDVPALRMADLMTQGDTVVIAGPRRATGYRFNAGVYAIDATSVTWSLLRKDGTVAAQKNVDYAAGRQVQHNAIVTSLFGAIAEAGDVTHARINSGRAFFYGSTVTESTGDPTFVHAMRTRENLFAVVAGIDIDENGTIDVSDQNNDLRIDQPIEVLTARFPTYFRLVASDPEGETLTYQLVDAGNDVKIEADGTIQWMANADLAGKTSTLTVRISDGTDSVDVVIPVTFR